MAEPFAPYAGIEGAALTGGEGGDLLHRLLLSALQGTAQIPQNVVEAAKSTAPGLRREDFTDIPATPAPFGFKVPEEHPGAPLVAGAADTALALAGTSMPFAKPGTLGIFGGRMANTADLSALQKAEKMHAAGADKVAIWDETGWFQGGDGKWRFEIPDDKARLNPNTFGAGNMPGGWPQEGPIASQLWHPDLYAAYPDARRAHGYFENDRPGGSYQEAQHSPTGQETIKIQAKTVPEARSIALHEAQHLVQGREGFSPGGSMAYFTQADDAEKAARALAYRREIARLDPSLTPKQKDDIIRKQYEEMGAPDWFPDKISRSWAHDVEGNPQSTLERLTRLYGLDQRVTPYSPRELYSEIPGEVEARNVQRRAEMTPEERRRTPPWVTEDRSPRPIMNEIFGSGRVGSLEGGAQMSMPVDPVRSGDAGPIRAYHGSPHDFDRFDLSKIGTGEGAQAYGRGLYFAEREGVAKSYRDALAADPRDKITEMVQGWTGYRQPGELATDEMVRKGLSNHHVSALNDAAKNPDFVRDLVTYINGHSDDLRTISPEAMSALKRMDKVLPKPGGHMYEVGINADPTHFLDWDKPIAQQGSRVDQAVYDVLTRSGATKAEASHIVNSKTGQDVIRRISRPSFPIRDPGTEAWRAGGKTYDESLALVGGDKRNVNRMFTPDPEYTRQALLSERIPGVRYADQGSRLNPAILPNNPMANEARQFLEKSKGSADDALKAFNASAPHERWATTERDEIRKVIKEAARPMTSNFVVFDDKLVDILRKYGLAGAAPVGALAGGMPREEQ